MTVQVRNNSLLAMAIAVGLVSITVICWLHSAAISRDFLDTLTSPEEPPGSHFELNFDYNLGDPSPYTRLLGAEHYDPYLRIPGDAPVHVRIYTHRGKLCAHLALPDGAELPEGIRVIGRVQQTSMIYRRHPDGLRHPLRLLLLTFELWGKESPRPLAVILQTIELDIMAHTADYVPCLTLPDAYAGRPCKDINMPHRGELPSKIDAPPVPAAILRMVYALASVEDQTHADLVASALREYADIVIRHEPFPLRPWPDNWGEIKGYVRDASRLITPTLTYLQEHECFHSSNLSSFINGQVFEAIFGTRFEDTSSDRVQRQPIPMYRRPNLPCDTCELQN